jgi:hypothetical protein
MSFALYWSILTGVTMHHFAISAFKDQVELHLTKRGSNAKSIIGNPKATIIDKVEKWI